MAQPVIGIVGGGQLAGLLAVAAKDQGLTVLALDPDAHCPAVIMGATHFPGHRHNAADILKLAEAVDVLTVDLEDVNVEALGQAESNGSNVIPRPATLKLLTNKLRQKQLYAEAGLPTSPFTEYNGDLETLGTHGWPAVQKAAEGGYDGRGVAILQHPDDLDKRLQAPGFVEAFVADATELSVMVARHPFGSIATWDAVEMAFNSEGNMLDELIAPARLDTMLREEAQALAIKAVEAFDGVGIFGVELFLTPEKKLLINEIAPRTHNSGHYTVDACRTSQFQQQINILTNRRLEDTAQEKAAVMFNLLGEPGFEGDTVVEGLESLLETDGVHPYLYGKTKCFPLRKMGHVTVVAESIGEARQLADQARQTIVVRGNQRTEK